MKLALILGKGSASKRAQCGQLREKYSTTVVGASALPRVTSSGHTLSSAAATVPIDPRATAAATTTRQTPRKASSVPIGAPDIREVTTRSQAADRDWRALG